MKVRIEVNEKVATEFFEESPSDLDLGHLPFNTFTVAFPIGALSSKEVLKERYRKDTGSTVSEAELDRIVEAARKKEYELLFQAVKNDRYRLRLTLPHFNETVLEFDILVGDMPINIPLIRVDNTGLASPLMLAMRVDRLVRNLLVYLSKPRETIITKVDAKPKPSRKKGKGKPSSKAYLYSKTYLIEVIEEDKGEEEEKRSYNRKRDSWMVRGHWRNYKSGKRVWVEPFKKGKEVQSETYRITKTD